MLPVGRKPVVQYVVDELTRGGIERILFVTGPGKTSIENHFDVNAELIQLLRESGKEELLSELSFERAPVRYFFTRQRRLLGLGHAVSCASSFVGDQPFVVALGDSIIGMNAQSDVVQRMTECYTDTGADAVVAFEEVPMRDIHRYGVAKPKQTGDIFELEDVIEKPSIEEAPSNLAIAARYVLAPTIFNALSQTVAGKGGEIQLTDAIRLIIQGGGKVYGVLLGKKEPRYDIGNFESYFKAFVDFALADERVGDSLRRHLEEVLHVDHP
jgi:UTP--glucose-1-phosphate uridylyltransferase